MSKHSAARHSLTASSLPTVALRYSSNLAPIEPFPSPFSGHVSEQGLQTTAYIEAHGRSEAATEPPRNQDHHASHDTEASAPVEGDQVIKKERKKRAPVIVPEIVNIVELPPISAEVVTELDGLKRYCTTHNVKGFEYYDTLIRNYCDPNRRLPAIQRMRRDVANSGQICEVAKKSTKSRGRQSVKCLVPDCRVEITGDNVLPKFGDHYWKKHVGFKDPYTCFGVSCGRTFHHAQSRDRHQRGAHSLFLPNSDVVKEQRKQKQNEQKEKGPTGGQLAYLTEYGTLEAGPAVNAASPSNSEVETFWCILPSVAASDSQLHASTSSPRTSVAGVDSRAPAGNDRFRPYQLQQGHHTPTTPGYSNLEHDTTPSHQVDRTVGVDHTSDGSLLRRSGVSQLAENSSLNASLYHHYGTQARVHGGIHMVAQVWDAQDQHPRTNPPLTLPYYQPAFPAQEYDPMPLQQPRYNTRGTGPGLPPTVHARQHDMHQQQRDMLTQQGGPRSSNRQGTFCSYQPSWGGNGGATVFVHPGQFPNEIGGPGEHQYHSPGTSSGYTGQDPPTASSVPAAPSGVQSHAQMQPRPNFDSHLAALYPDAQGTTVDREVYTSPFTNDPFRDISGGTITGLATGDATATQPNHYEDKPNYYEDNYCKSTPF